MLRPGRPLAGQRRQQGQRRRSSGTWRSCARCTTFAGHTKRVNALAFAPDGHTLATASRDGTVRLWDVASGEERQS